MNYVQNKLTVHTYILAILLLFVAISPPYNQGMAGSKETKTTSGNVATGVVSTVSNNGEKDTKKTVAGKFNKRIQEGDNTKQANQGYKCDIQCKTKQLIEVGIRPEIANSLVENCKALAENPVRCIKIGAFIVQNESSGGTNCKKSNKYNCFGLSVKDDYKSYNDGVLHFVGKYNRFWYNQTTPDSFYSNSPEWKPKTWYCLSEYQPDGSKLPYCKNGHKNAWAVYNKLTF